MTADPSVALGLERYAHLVHHPQKFTPELFETGRFLDIRAGDTYYDSFGFFDFPLYEDVAARYGTALVFGDKIPMLHPLYPQIAHAFPEPKILFIVRNPFDVAASFTKRALDDTDETWRPSRDHRAACNEWNASIRATSGWLERLAFYIVDYESFFAGQADIARLAAFLELDPDRLRLGYEAQVARQPEPRHEEALTAAARQYVARTADFEAYRRLLELADQARFPGSAPAQPIRRGGRKYEDEDHRVVDYEYYEAVPGRWFRGPPLATRRPQITFLGAASTFGRLVDRPYPSLVAERLDRHALNLGYGGVRAPFYYTDHRLLRLINACDCAVVEFFSARGTATPSLEPRDHQSAFIRLRGSQSDFVFADQLFANLLSRWPAAEVGRVAEEIQAAYTDDMAQLLDRIEVPTILVWFSQRMPREHLDFGNVSEFMGEFPHLVTRPVVDALRERVDGYLEVVSNTGIPSPLVDRHDHRPVPIFEWAPQPDMNFYYPSPEMHELAAEVIAEQIAAVTEIARARP